VLFLIERCLFEKIYIYSYFLAHFWNNTFLPIFPSIISVTFFFRKRCWFSFLYMHFASILWNDVAMWGLFWLQFLLLFSSLSNYWFCDYLFMFFFNFSFIMTCLHNERLDKYLSFVDFFFENKWSFIKKKSSQITHLNRANVDLKF
jgi:hypothetical protein